jgi:hypothetical protein
MKPQEPHRPDVLFVVNTKREEKKIAKLGSIRLTA